MNRAIIHVGPHKTGSTYIQKRLTDDREYLRSHDWTYVEKGTYLYGNHNVINWLTSNNEQELNGLKQCCSGQNVILSSENFVLLTDEGVKRLASLLSAHKVSIIYYFRDRGKLLVSNWQEHVKNGEIRTISEFLIEHISNPYGSIILNSLLVLDKFEECFGRDSVVVRNYDNITSNKEDIYTDFLNHLEIPMCPGAHGFKVNQSIGLSHAELLRVLNVRAKSEGLLVGANVIQALHELHANEKSALTRKAIRIVESDFIKVNIGNTAIVRILNNELAKQYDLNIGDPRESADLFPSTKTLSRPGFNMLVDEIYKQLKHKLL